MCSNDAVETQTERTGGARVLCVLVCHNGAAWLPQVLAGIGASDERPWHVLAVDNGSDDDTPALLDSSETVDGVLTLTGEDGYAAAVRAGVSHARQRWGEVGEWLWLLHDDSVPEEHCLSTLLSVAEPAPSVGILGPLQLDWSDERLIVEAGLSADASGHRQSGVLAADPDWASGGDAGFERNTEVLAVSSAGALIRTELWDELDGFDEAYRVFGEDLDFGWRANATGHLALVVPAARLRHRRALLRGVRTDAPSARLSDRVGGMRAFLSNVGTLGYVLGLPRLALLCLLRGFGQLLLGRFGNAAAELRAYPAVLRSGLTAARRERKHTRLRGLLTTRRDRLRAGVRAALAAVLRRGLAERAALGRLSEASSRTLEIPRTVHHAVVPAAAVRRGRHAARRGLRLPANSVVVPSPQPEQAAEPPPERPSPTRRDQPRQPEQPLTFVELSRAQLARQILLAPVLLLTVGLLIVAVLLHRNRFGIDLAGGGTLPVPGLGATWKEYFAAWHPVAAGTGAHAPAALAVLGVLGAPFWLIGGPAVAVSLLFLLDLPLAGLSAYRALRSLRLPPWGRALIAAGYALLPASTAAVTQGRLGTVVVHILLPLVLAGLRTVLLPKARTQGRVEWLPATTLCALGLAVLGAFSPLVALLLIVLALVGFVVVPAAPGTARRRIGSLFVLVLLPIALLLPWPAVLLRHPGMLLHGVGAANGGSHTAVTSLVTLAPGGHGSWPLIGVLLLFAALLAVLLRPRRGQVACLLVVVFGGLGAAATALLPMPEATGGAAVPGWPGAPLVLAGAGVLLLVAVGGQPDRTARRQGGRRRADPGRGPVVALAVAGGIGVVALAASAVTAGAGGPLRDGGGTRLPSAEQARLHEKGTGALVLGTKGEPARLRAGATPRFGDDDLPGVAAGQSRLAGWVRMLDGQRASVRTFVGQAAAAGVEYVVPVSGTQADRMRTTAGGLLDDAGRATDGRPVLRIRTDAAPVRLIAPALAKQAVTGGTPEASPAPDSVTPVGSRPPDASVHVAEGSRGRLLVVGAEYEAGWRVTVDGKPAAITKAWGHQVSVSVPQNGADLRISYSSALRDGLLLVQAAALLFTVLTAIPMRRPGNAGSTD